LHRQGGAVAKFKAWPHGSSTLRNPLYHWTHLELKRYFGIDELLTESTATRIWNKANEQLATPKLSTQASSEISSQSPLHTDDPVDDLCHHESLAASNCGTSIYPAFRRIRLSP